MNIYIIEQEHDTTKTLPVYFKQNDKVHRLTYMIKNIDSNIMADQLIDICS